MKQKTLSPAFKLLAVIARFHGKGYLFDSVRQLGRLLNNGEAQSMAVFAVCGLDADGNPLNTTCAYAPGIGDTGPAGFPAFVCKQLDEIREDGGLVVGVSLAFKLPQSRTTVHLVDIAIGQDFKGGHEARRHVNENRLNARLEHLEPYIKNDVWYRGFPEHVQADIDTIFFNVTNVDNFDAGECSAWLRGNFIGNELSHKDAPRLITKAVAHE